jgi:hypothetical protein
MNSRIHFSVYWSKPTFTRNIWEGREEQALLLNYASGTLTRVCSWHYRTVALQTSILGGLSQKNLR